MIESKTILESENFIVLDKYERLPEIASVFKLPKRSGYGR